MNNFLESISESFQKPIFVSISVLSAVFLFVLILFFIMLVQKSRDRNRIKKSVLGMYQQLVSKHQLTTEETDVIERMSVYMLNPQKKYLLLSNQHTFNYCKHRFLEHHTEPDPSVIKSLEFKLGFDAYTPIDQPDATVQLQKDTLVIIEWSDKSKTNGSIARNEPDNFEVALTAPYQGARAGEKVRIFVNDFRGIIYFACEIIAVHKTALNLKHSFERLLIQRREEIRIKMDTPIYIRRELGDTPAIKAVLTDISTGGARVTIPAKQFQRGDDVRLFFQLEIGERQSINAEVVRITKGGLQLHLHFAHLPARVKQKIRGLAE